MQSGEFSLSIYTYIEGDFEKRECQKRASGQLVGNIISVKANKNDRAAFEESMEIEARKR